MKNQIIGIGAGIAIGVVATSAIFTIILPNKPKDESLVPKFDDVKNIVLDGEKISASKFAELYCTGKFKKTAEDHFYCQEAINEAVRQSMSINNKNSPFYGRKLPDPY